MRGLTSNHKRFFGWALFLLLLAIWVAKEINSDLSSRWPTEAEYNRAMKLNDKAP